MMSRRPVQTHRWPTALLLGAMAIPFACNNNNDPGGVGPWMVPSANGPSGSTNASGGDPGGSAPRVPFGEPADANVLAWRSGPEPPWLVSVGSLAGFNAILGSLVTNNGPVVLESSLSGSHVSGVPGAPSPDMAMDCGKGCALLAESSLVYGAGGGNPAAGAVVTIVTGQTQVRFGWSPGAKAWVPDPYVYANLGAVGTSGPIDNAQSPADFANAVAWVVYQRDLAFDVYEKFGNVFRITERNDALASLDKRNSPTKPPPTFMRGRTLKYVRSGAAGQLDEILDYRSPGLKAMVVDRFGSSDGDKAGFVKAVHLEVANGTAAGHYVLDYTGKQLEKVAKDANDPTGAVFRKPHVFKYADADAARLESLTDPFGDVLHYTWNGDKRLLTQRHDGPTGAEKEELTFDYNCGSSPCAAGVAPQWVTETDEDGFVKRTVFGAFPAPNTGAVYVTEKGQGVAGAPGAAPTVDESSRTLYQRDATGYLVRSYSVADRLLRSWNSDGAPARHFRVVRTDRGVDLAAFTAALPPKSLAALDYQMVWFDGDNQPVRQVGPDGLKTFAYQKAIHKTDGESWAGQMLLRSVSTKKSADQTAPQDESSTEVVRVQSREEVTGAATPAAPAAGSACVFEGECVAGGLKCVNAVVTAESSCTAPGPSPCANLYPDPYAFLVTVQATLTGGVQCAWLDEKMRPVASLGPGDGRLPRTTSYHPVYGSIAVNSQPSGAKSIARDYAAGGYVERETVTTCGYTTFTRNYKSTPTVNEMTETVGNGTPVVTRNRLDVDTGLTTSTLVSGANYTKTSDFTHANNSAAVVKRVDTYMPVGANPVVESVSWYMRGYGGPPP